jgi:DnaJ like chaperone protein
MNEINSTPASSIMSAPAVMRGVLMQGLVSLAGSLIVVDAPLNREEYSAFRVLFPMNPRRDLSVRQMLQAAMNNPVAPLTAGKLLAPLFEQGMTLREEMLARFVALAWADASVHPTEQRWLEDFTAALVLPREVLTELLQHIEPYSHEKDPYHVLDVAPTATDIEIKRAWQHKLRLFHPDAIAARGLPEDEPRSFGQRMTEINAAYDTILKARGIR